MSVEKEYTLDEIEKHTSPEDCWLIIGNANNGGPKVYNVSKYLDDHPGGAEVILDVAGQDADEFFEDIGHSKEARAELQKYLIGSFKMDEAALAAMQAKAEARKNQSSGSSAVVIVLIALIAVAFGYYQTQMS